MKANSIQERLEALHYTYWTWKSMRASVYKFMSEGRCLREILVLVHKRMNIWE